MKLLRVLLLGTFAVVAMTWWGCGEPSVVAPDTIDPFSAARTPNPPDVESLAIGPIEGLTTGWHQLPTVDGPLAVPEGVTLQLKVPVPRDASVQWSGAFETRRDAKASYAQCPADRIGRLRIGVDVVLSGGESPHTTYATFEVIAAQPSAVNVTPISLRDKKVPPAEFMSNHETMDWYFNHSVAQLNEVAPGHFRTSAHQIVQMTTEASHGRLAWLTEWRVNGQAQGLGTVFNRGLNAIGSNVISVGPPEAAASIRIDVYGVTITSHESITDLIPEGEAVTFKAVTDPPGFESEITWLASTKYGRAEPTMGKGGEFTVTFFDTLSQTQWLGVKADFDVFGQDQKEWHGEEPTPLPSDGDGNGGGLLSIQVCTNLHELYPNYCDNWHVEAIESQGGPARPIRRCDVLRLRRQSDNAVIYVHVKAIVPTYWLTCISNLEQSAAERDDHGDSTPPGTGDGNCQGWHEIWPNYCSPSHQTSGPKNPQACDVIGLDGQDYHVDFITTNIIACKVTIES